MKKEYIKPTILSQGLFQEELLLGTSDTEFSGENDAKERTPFSFADDNDFGFGNEE